MPLQKIQFAPGISKEGTDYTVDQGWTDSDKIRFRKGRPEKIGGWEKFSTNTYEGVGRSLYTWSSLGATKHTGLGTNLKFYITEGINFNDVTPLRATTSAGDVTFSASNNDSTVTVTDVSHGAIVNDFVTFSGAASLTSVTFGSGLTSIGTSAFQNTALTSVTIPDSVTSIGGRAFSGAVSLTSVTFGSGLKSIAERAFQNTALTSLTIPNSVTTIGSYAFQGLTSLTSLTLGSGITSVGYNSFEGRLSHFLFIQKGPYP